MSPVPFREALRVWWRIGFLSFGGPAGQIALMHRILIEEKRWLDEPRFLHALNYCMLLPGPEAQQLATYIGWLMHGVRGGIAAGVIFILPGAVIMLLLSLLYVLLGDLPIVDGFFFGMKAAVMAIVIQALLRISRKALHGRTDYLLAMVGLLGLFIFNLPFPLLVLGAGLYGYLRSQWSGSPGLSAMTSHTLDVTVRPGTRTAALICLLLWALTLGGLFLLAGGENIYTQIATFFSKLAVVTFGGAYAVLSYVAQQGVENYHWLQPGEMLDGLGLAETTPGPLILVTQYVGFLAALRQAGPDAGLLAATLGGLLTTWVTFLPCFFWIFAGAPYVESLRNHRALSAALTAITAVVVGVIANLALWFGLHALFARHLPVQGYGVDMQVPDFGSLDLPMLALICIAMVLVFKVRLDVLKVLGLCAVSGIVWTLAS
jgi:chromate transporter